MKTVQVLREKDTLAPLWYALEEKARFIGGFVRYMCTPAFEPVKPGDIDIYPITNKDGTNEFVKTENGGKYFAGECMMFCKDAATIGFPTYMIGDIVCKHIPPQIFVVPPQPVSPATDASVGEEKKEEKRAETAKSGKDKK